MVNQGAAFAASHFQAEVKDYLGPGFVWLSCEVGGFSRSSTQLLAATEEELAKIAAATGRQRRPLCGKDTSALRGGQGDQPLQNGQAL
jgi:hypothetical protein